MRERRERREQIGTNNEKLRITVQKMKVRVTKSYKVDYIAIQEV